MGYDETRGVGVGWQPIANGPVRGGRVGWHCRGRIRSRSVPTAQAWQAISCSASRVSRLAKNAVPSLAPADRYFRAGAMSASGKAGLSLEL